MTHHLPAHLTFEGVDLKIIDRNGRPWIAAADLARALGYSRVDKVTRLYSRHEGEFTPDMTETPKVGVAKNNNLGHRIGSKLKLISENPATQKPNRQSISYRRKGW